MSIPANKPLSIRHIPRLLGLLTIAIAVTMLILVLFPGGTPRYVAHRAISLSNMRQFLVAVAEYAAEHDGRWPDSLEGLMEGYLPEPVQGERYLLVNPREDHWTYKLIVPDLPPEDLNNLSETPVLYELRTDGTIDPDGCIGDADGHVEGPRERAESP